MASKALSERASWDWMAAHGDELSFDLTCINPAGVLGPHYLGALADKGKTLDLSNLNIGSRMLWYIADPTVGATPFNDYHMGCWVGVYDTAAALVAAVAEPAAGGKRFLCAQRCHWQLIRGAIRAAVPELRGRVGAEAVGAGAPDPEATYDIDGSEVTKVLGIKYTSLEDAMKDTFAQFLEAESELWRLEDYQYKVRKTG
ncbi:hypothetical protein BDV06DRAFT_205944 [Aspergillus oleicola]